MKRSYTELVQRGPRRIVDRVRRDNLICIGVAAIAVASYVRFCFWLAA